MAQPNYNLSISQGLETGKKAKRTAVTIDDDVLLEILFRVSANIAALFRCAAACKRWCALIADPSFLHRRWPEKEKKGHPSALLGFFIQRNLGYSPEPPAFVPAPSGSGPTLGGASCRSLSWLVRAVPAGLLDGAKPVAARGGLALVRLSCTNSIHLAVCDVLARTCHMLPPLECPVSTISCAILTGSDYPCSSGRQRTSTPGYSTFFTVLTLVNSATHGHDRTCDLYSFSSAKPGWSAPRSCFGDTIWSAGAPKGGFCMRFGNHGQYKAVVHRGITHWVAAYLSKNAVPQKYYTFNVNIETGHVSLTEISIPAYQLTKNRYDWPMLGVGADRMLTLFYVYEEAGIPRLDIWKKDRQDNGRESATSFWLRVGVFDLKSPKEKWHPRHIHVWSGEKSNTLFILDALFPAHKLDTQTGVMEIVTGLFQRELCIGAVFMEIDWPTLFLSRLGRHLC